MKEIDIRQAFTIEDHVFIDVRSPGEFDESHIPGAINVPIFNDEERAKVGTTYKIKGQDPAKWLGMELVSPKIPHLMQCIREVSESGKKPIIYCWRGGMRSKSVATFSEMAGLQVQRLTGGFKQYRQWIVDNLNETILPNRFIVLHGMTGVGKTMILDRLKGKGFPILDLEACAGHRGSVFGGIGAPVYNQKTFESNLYHQLEKIKGLPLVFMEAESRRIGKAVQPEFLLEAKAKGIHVVLETSVEIRAKRIYEEYVIPYKSEAQFQERVKEAVTPILKRFIPAIKDELIQHIDKEDYKNLIVLLLEQYYDPRYQHKLEEYDGPFYHVRVDDIEDTVKHLTKIILQHQRDSTLVQG
ncbi:tRNA 2-selenouridine(34) synthase MnmH [Ammoniphilus sp. CFH 90114]|uniref:tRNA 2-selenouridine(34) synthase MnmH n=1 Tax=Ammoniphilus sp. CFH 90114 TaxID=2493665 RepID=UPI00100F37CA|nr:tRNA 2-selenouridine(34) synthase MnmH [Ammoniphilus sp. CFH 90114]RXT09074.1 tRNA 2-selenouridine(34) synthase MnmH [Ammoniphilus sp. CFH 90114]